MPTEVPCGIWMLTSDNINLETCSKKIIDLPSLTKYPLHLVNARGWDKQLLLWDKHTEAEVTFLLIKVINAVIGGDNFFYLCNADSVQLFIFLGRA